ncbi:MAG: ABC transporter substrate-binding protein [Promethearchaeota archaeon]
MKNKSTISLILFLFLLSFPFLLISDTSAISLEDNSLQNIIDAGKIVVGIDPYYPPFEQKNITTDEIEGFDPDIMQFIADDIGVSIEWVEVSWAGIFPGLESGNYNCIISAVTITEQRETTMDFSRWYYRSALSIMVNDDNPKGIETLGDVNSTDVKVGIQVSTPSEWYFDDEGIIAEKILFATTALAIQALISGTIDVVLGDFAALMDIKETSSDPLHTIDTFNEEEFGIPVQTGSDSLRLRINTILDELLGENIIHPEPNTYYNASHEAWFGIKPYLNYGGEITYYTISASCGDNGDINPDGEIEVAEGDNIKFIFTPDEGYLVSDVIVDAASVEILRGFTFSDVESNHTIAVEFTALPFEIPGYSTILSIIISFAVVAIVTVKIQHRKLK